MCKNRTYLLAGFAAFVRGSLVLADPLPRIKGVANVLRSEELGPSTHILGVYRERLPR